MTENKKYEKSTLGWLREQAKKDGFDNIRKWQNWKRKQTSKRINYIVDQLWTKEKVLDLIKKTYDNEKRILTRSEFCNNYNHPSENIIYKLFGSWNNALIEAELWDKRDFSRYTDEDLLGYLVRFYEENGRPPTIRDFTNNRKYPGFAIYQKRFGSWQKALKLVGLDTDSMVRKGVVKTENQKARLAEIFVREHFDDVEKVVDLSGTNCDSPFDGICPKGKIYDVKSSKLGNDRDRWIFNILNIHKDEIEWYYLLAFNGDYSELLHVWRISAWEFMEDIENGYLHIGIGNNYINNIENMKQYDITEKFMLLFKNWLDKIQGQVSNEGAIVSI